MPEMPGFKEEEMTQKEKAQAMMRLEVEGMEPKDRENLFKAMEVFRECAQETIKGGDELFRMCGGCAFRKGTDANDSPLTVLTATECVLKEETFYCHERFNQNGGLKLCNGWINVMNNAREKQ